MFKKKHSEINIKVPLKPYYPLRSKSPISAQPSPRNLSPMKNTFRNLHSRTQKRQMRQEQETRNLSPRNFENHFQSHFQNRAHYNEPQYDSTHRFPVNKFGFHTVLTNDMSYISNYSNISRENSHNQTIKQSKRLFTKCIAEMNSEKKKVCGERSQNNSNNTSVVENSKQATSDSKNRNGEPAPITSFKALKIQMIESVLPSDKKCSTIDRKNNEYDTPTGRQFKAREFMIEEPKKQQIIELFNQSFSNAGVSRITEQQGTSKLCTNLQAKAKILQSLYIQQESDYTDFDLIMQKVQMQPAKQKVIEIEQSVKISMESECGSLTMDPFF